MREFGSSRRRSILFFNLSKEDCALVHGIVNVRKYGMSEVFPLVKNILRGGSAAY